MKKYEPEFLTATFNVYGLISSNVSVLKTDMVDNKSGKVLAPENVKIDPSSFKLEKGETKEIRILVLGNETGVYEGQIMILEDVLLSPMKVVKLTAEILDPTILNQIIIVFFLGFFITWFLGLVCSHNSEGSPWIRKGSK